MTEAEWLACTDPAPMLRFLQVLQGNAYDRKLRLFAVACCRSIRHLLTDERSRRALDIAERYADRLASAGELHTARTEGYDAVSEAIPDFTGHASHPVQAASLARYHAAASVYYAANDEGSWYEAGNACPAASEAATASSMGARPAGQKTEQPAQCLLLRCLVGNPFRPSPPLPPAVLDWNDRTLRRLAEAIYEERKMPEGTFDTGRLAILADALLDAGCEDDDLISHLRSEGSHVRGCWALDLILGKS